MDKLELTAPPEAEKYWVIKFRYDDKNFEARQQRDNGLVTITILEEGEFEKGEITGSYVNKNDSEIAFKVSEVNNYGMEDVEDRPPEPMYDHTKYLIAETVVQILLSGKVDRWISSDYLNSGSMRMYAHIDEDGRVMVETVFDKNGEYHYEVTRKNQASILTLSAVPTELPVHRPS